MDDTSKYLIHADITADGVVERSDVVGAIFGQTEGLLGDELDLRDLQQSSKVGRIEVEIESQAGTSHGGVTIATSLDKVQTAVLAAALETITRVGPCRSTFEVTDIEDVRAAKRRQVVERARELLTEAFDDSVMSSDEILAAVREQIRVENIEEYEGLPAGPRVADSDAIVVVEGRADVLQLLKYGIKNAIAVEGTNVPPAVAELTTQRTVTAFLDGDRGGDLILEELSQVGDVDYVAFAPANRSVEDLDRAEVVAALREKVPYELVADASHPRESVAATDGSATPAPAKPDPDVDESSDDADSPTSEDDDASRSEDESGPDGPATLREHVESVIRDDSDSVRLLDGSFEAIAESDAAGAFETIESAEEPPVTVVLDGVLTQRVLDLAAQRGVDRIVADELGQFTKRPTGVRIHAAADLQQP